MVGSLPCVSLRFPPMRTHTLRLMPCMCGATFTMLEQMQLQYRPTWNEVRPLRSSSACTRQLFALHMKFQGRSNTCSYRLALKSWKNRMFRKPKLPKEGKSQILRSLRQPCPLGLAYRPLTGCRQLPFVGMVKPRCVGSRRGSGQPLPHSIKGQPVGLVTFSSTWTSRKPQGPMARFTWPVGLIVRTTLRSCSLRDPSSWDVDGLLSMERDHEAQRGWTVLQFHQTGEPLSQPTLRMRRIALAIQQASVRWWVFPEIPGHLRYQGRKQPSKPAAGLAWWPFWASWPRGCRCPIEGFHQRTAKQPCAVDVKRAWVKERGGFEYFDRHHQTAEQRF